MTHMAKALSPESKEDMVVPIFHIMSWMLAFPRLNLSCQSEQMSGVVQQCYNTGMMFVQLSLQINIWEENCHVMIALGISAW